jgi:hypothetical protein
MMSNALLSQDSYLEVSQELAATITAAAAGKTFTRSAGSFITDGVIVGDRFTINDALNPNEYTVTVVQALVLTVTETVVDSTSAARVITHFVKVGEVTSMGTPSRDRPDIDVTHLKSTAKEYRKGLRDEGSISGESNFLASDTGQNIMRSMLDEQEAPRSCAITVPAKEGNDGYRWSFEAYVSSMGSQISTDDKISQSFEMRITGEVTEEVIEA